jgi:hypothetical protein
MNRPGAPSLQLLLGQPLLDEARRGLRLVLRVVPPARTICGLIRCAGSRHRSRPDRCCEEVRCHASARACGSR